MCTCRHMQLWVCILNTVRACKKYIYMCKCTLLHVCKHTCVTATERYTSLCFVYHDFVESENESPSINVFFLMVFSVMHLRLVK